jgi:hypothetical protein
MASHKLNASSSRSHCLLTLYIDSSPLASPSEVISSRLTLVDLAGSERGVTVGATEGEWKGASRWGQQRVRGKGPNGGGKKG